MKVAYFTGIRKIELADRPRPEPQRPDDVLVRIDRVGVCGSDVHYYVDGHIGDQMLHYPATLGHECSGTVIAMGPAVRNLQQGDRVAIDPALVCGRCDQCRAGRSNTCRKLRFMGNPGEEPGALAEYCVLPAENCFPIPDSMTLDQAVLAEPLSVGLYAVRLAELTPNLAVGILGSGPIGLSVLLAAKAVAPGRAYVTDLIDRRLEAARTCGADWTSSAAAAGIVQQMLAQEPAGLDVVFECSGDPRCIDQAMVALKPGGRLVIVGIPAQQRVDFDAHMMRRKELTFKNVRRQRGCVAPVVELIADRRVNPDPMLTHRFPMAAAEQAFELVAGYADGVIKAVIELHAE
jgi:L-iditol 2-dehydrogenase